MDEEKLIRILKEEVRPDIWTRNIIINQLYDKLKEFKK